MPNSASSSAKNEANVCLIITLCGTMLNTKFYCSLWWRRKPNSGSGYPYLSKHRGSHTRKRSYNALNAPTSDFMPLVVLGHYQTTKSPCRAFYGLTRALYKMVWLFRFKIGSVGFCVGLCGLFAHWGK